jgi:hypothetical protein
VVRPSNQFKYCLVQPRPFFLHTFRSVVCGWCWPGAGGVPERNRPYAALVHSSRNHFNLKTGASQRSSLNQEWTSTQTPPRHIHNTHRAPCSSPQEEEEKNVPKITLRVILLLRTKAEGLLGLDIYILEKKKRGEMSVRAKIDGEGFKPRPKSTGLMRDALRAYAYAHEGPSKFNSGKTLE